MIVITHTLTAVVVIGAGQYLAVMVGRVVNMNDVNGNDDDAKPAPTTRTWAAARTASVARRTA